MTAPQPDEDEDEFTELFDANLPRVDGVGRGANGTSFLLAKSEATAGLLDPDFIRDLIAKSEPTPSRAGVKGDDTVTITGSPAAVSKMIHDAAMRARVAPESVYVPDDAAEVAKSDAAYEAVLKAKYSAEDKRKMLAAGHAIKNADGEPSYPIGDKDDLDKAVTAVGRGGADHDHVRAYIVRRAKALGAASMIPDNWNADGSLKQAVTKDALVQDPDAGVDGLDPTVPLAAPDEDAPGDPTDPGSPAWEAIDAATAQKWTAIAVRLKNALGILADRETLEAATVDPDDAESAWDLQDAMCAVDYVIDTLAGFAVGEQAEADLATEAMAIGKAMAGFDPAPLDVVEGLAVVRKAGRVLSAANEAKIRTAEQSLREVLASLPAPADSSGQPVAKQKEAAVDGTETTEPQTVTKADASPDEQARDTGPVDAGGTTGMGQPRTTGPAPALPADGPQAALPGDVPGRVVVKSAGGPAALKVAVYDHARARLGLVRPDAIRLSVAKADSDAGAKATMQAVFDEDGDLIGIVDPADITPVAGAGKKADDGDDAPSDGDSDASTDADMTPQPPAQAGTPAEDVAKSGDPGEDQITITQDVLKSIAEQAARQALDAQETVHKEVVAKLAAGRDELAQKVETLKGRVERVESQPAMPKVFTHGQVPPAHQLRGQDQGAVPVDVAKAQQMRQAFTNSRDAGEQKALADEMQAAAIGQLAALRQASPRPAPRSA